MSGNKRDVLFGVNPRRTKEGTKILAMPQVSYMPDFRKKTKF